MDGGIYILLFALLRCNQLIVDWPVIFQKLSFEHYGTTKHKRPSPDSLLLTFWRVPEVGRVRI